MHKLEQIRERLQINKSEMARRLGISKSNYSMIIHGQHGISKRVALTIHQKFGVPLEEILCPPVHRTGTGAQAATLDTDQPASA
ncbi:MAG TPA: helix-turn-helix transcriptional regulator [Firmicutes bacterium]|nr:helix-turn-helix transcriptional regulator [Bacillota bacterium]